MKRMIKNKLDRTKYKRRLEILKDEVLEMVKKADCFMDTIRNSRGKIYIYFLIILYDT